MSINKNASSIRDTIDDRFMTPYPVVSFIYFNDGKYNVFINNKEDGDGTLEKNKSGESGDYEGKHWGQNDIIKIEVDQYNPFQFTYDNNYRHIYLWYSTGDSLRIEYSNKQYDFE